MSGVGEGIGTQGCTGREPGAENLPAVDHTWTPCRALLILMLPWLRSPRMSLRHTVFFTKPGALIRPKRRRGCGQARGRGSLSAGPSRACCLFQSRTLRFQKCHKWKNRAGTLLGAWHGQTYARFLRNLAPAHGHELLGCSKGYSQRESCRLESWERANLPGSLLRTASPHWELKCLWGTLQSPVITVG